MRTTTYDSPWLQTQRGWFHLPDMERRCAATGTVTNTNFKRRRERVSRLQHWFEVRLSLEGYLTYSGMSRLPYLACRLRRCWAPLLPDTTCGPPAENFHHWPYYLNFQQKWWRNPLNLSPVFPSFSKGRIWLRWYIFKLIRRIECRGPYNKFDEVLKVMKGCCGKETISRHRRGKMLVPTSRLFTSIMVSLSTLIR